MTSTPRNGVARTATDLWYSRWTPAEYAAEEDQIHPGATVFQGFKSALLAVKEPRGTRRLFADTSLPCLTELTTPDLRPSWPLSAFMVELDLPSEEEMQVMRRACISQFGPHCPVLQMEPAESLEIGCPDVSLAMAALGSTLLCSSHQSSVWINANRTLTAVIGMNNSQTRASNIHIAWLLNETAAVMSSDSSLWRLANIIHGFVETALRKFLKAPNSTTISGTSGTFRQRLSSITRYALQIDLVRALHFGTVPTIAAAFGNMPLDDPPNSSIARIQGVMFGQTSPTWPIETENSASLELLILLNQIIAFTIVLHPLGRDLPQSSTASGKLLSLTQTDETRRSRNRITSALSKWGELHLQTSPPAIRALYHFSKLHLLIPDIQSVLIEARYAPRFHQNTAPITPDASTDTTTTAAQAIHNAWLLLESVSECEDRICVWLPIITFMAGLYVWRHIKSQGESRVHGSTKVVQLFRAEIERMPWLCCKTMIETLKGLA